MKNFTLKKMIILFAMVPLITAIVTLAVFNMLYMRSALGTQVRNTLQVAATDLYEYYIYDLRNQENLVDGWIEYETDYIDHLKDEGVELTMFKGDTRFCTSIKDASGKRIEGTKASDAVIREVIQGGNVYFSDDTVINGDKYYVYYVPIKDASGAVIGMAFAGRNGAEVQAMVNRSALVTLSISAVLLILFIVVCLILARKVSDPIRDCADTLEKIAGGDLNVQLDAQSHIEETKELIHASGTLQEKLSEILGTIRNVSMQLNDDAQNVHTLAETSADNAGQISTTMEDLANGATSLAENVQDINEQVVHMSETIDSLTESSSALSVSSENIKNANNEAQKYIDKVSGSSLQSVEAVGDISRQITETNEAVQKIQNAVEMITSIAGQTNLLALNASIEAARAGEAGRGFAVVATEIGNLSTQSSSSASDIKTIVEEIIEKSEASVKLSGTVAETIREEQGFISETQEKFRTLNEEIEASLQQIHQVAANAKSLDEVRDVIAQAVQDLSAISEENAASNEEVSASLTGIAQSVNDITVSSDSTQSNAGRLVDAIGYFR